MNAKALIVAGIGPAILALLTLCAAAPADAQSDSESTPASSQVSHRPIGFKHFTIEDGLAANQTYNVLQSRQGFIWIATRQGLSKYDGSEFTTYSHDPDDPNSLASSYVWGMNETSDGVLWLSMWGGGVDRFDPVTENVTHYRAEKGNTNSLSSNFVNSSFQDSKGYVWIATDKYLDKLDPRTNTVTHYRPNPDDPNSLGAPVYTVREDAQGVLWLGTYKGLDRFDPATETFTHYRHEEGNPNSLNGGYVWALFIDNTGIIWVGAEGGGLNRFDPTTETFTHYQHSDNDPASLSNDTVTFLTSDNEKRLWVGTLGGGLDLFDPRSGRFRTFRFDKNDPNSLSNNTVWSVVEDGAGAYWIATESGLDYYDPKGHRFDLYRSSATNPNSLSSSFVMSFYEDEQGILWIGTMGGGLNKFDRRSGKFSHYQHDPANPNSLVHDDVNRIVPGRAGTLWLGTSGGLDRFDPATETLVHYRHDPANANSLLTNNIQGLIRDAAGMLWIASFNGGISHFDPESETFTHFTHNADDPNSLASNSVYDFLESTDGTLWIACQGGLSRLNLKTNTFTNYTIEDNHLSDAVIEDVYEDSRGTIWVSTDNGLNRFDEATRTFTNYYAKDGLPSNHISGVIEDDQGYLWIATYGGIAKFDPKTKIFRTYDVRDGLQGNQFSQAIYKTRKGELILGGVNGFNTFYPDKLHDNPYIPKVVLTDLKLRNREVKIGADSPLKKQINITKHLVLPYDYTVLTLKFSALSFRSPEKNRYAYMLVGFDRDWTYTGSTNRIATYTNLDPGDYAFRVKASNNDGVWNKQGTTLKIIITPPWWATWWSRSAFIAVLLVLTYSGYRWRVRSIEQRSVELEHEVAERTHELAETNEKLQVAKDRAELANKAKSIFLANMSHELRTPLNAVLGFSSLMRKDPKMPDNQLQNLHIINRSGEHLLTLINDILDMAKIEAGQVRLENAPFDLGAMVRDITDMMRIRAEDKDLELQIDQSSRFPRYVVGDEARMRQILINLMGNAIKYTQQGGVALRLGTRSNEIGHLVIEVEDTGIGIASEDQQHIFEPFVQLGEHTVSKGTGLGLAITHQFVQVMGGSITLESTPGEGSVFRVELPLTEATESGITKSKQAESGNVVGLLPRQPEYRILIVEDQRDNQMLLAQLLMTVGFHIKIAENGEEGVQMFKDWHPHFIWMDRRMPVMDGLEATRRIRALPDGKEVKIVAVTASVFSDQRNEVLEVGMDDFVRKPFRASEIYDCMSKYLGVQYVYEEEREAKRKDLTLTSKMLEGVPAELLGELKEALESLDAERIDSAIQQVAKHDQTLREKLNGLADNFDYPAILRVLRKTEES